MNWDLDFISRDNLKKHIKNTVECYNECLKSMTLSKFNDNIIDPIKLTFDSKVFHKDIETIICDEISRQKDKSNNNSIGYFHQNLFKYIKRCDVPKTGWDVIFTDASGTRIVVEMKNKHNTMNSSSAAKTYLKMQHHLINNNKDKCYLVEIIAKHSQNVPWVVSVDGIRFSDSSIRRVSIDKFYEEVTGDKFAFYKICTQLPILLDEIISENRCLKPEKDTVFDELVNLDSNLLRALYLLAFGEYEGF